jgi:3-phosphoshikimate 1-carboxyvinyltransferase
MTPTGVKIEPAHGLRGTLVPPPDKSISHRCALVGTMAVEPVRVHNYLDAGDTNATLDAIRSVGAVVENRPDEIVIRGTGLRAAGEADSPIDVRNAGTLMRLLPGWLAGQPGGLHWTIDGDASIRRRPVDRIAEPLRQMGGRIDATDGRYPPFTVFGSDLSGIDYALPVASAQVKSCAMLAALLASGETSIAEPHPTRDHTERLLLRAGVPVRREGNRVVVPSTDELELDDVTVPGDLSSAAFFIAAGVLVPRSRLLVEGVGVNWTRQGFLRVLERMGGIVVGDLEELGTPPGPDEPVADLDVTAGPLEGTTVEAEEVPLAIDELPLIALLGCFAEGETVVKGAGELRLKESDRIAGVVDGLRGLGADIEATEDGFAVRGTGELRGGALDSRGDHRLAMLGAVAGLASQEGVEVLGMDAAAISYPGFPEDLAALV